LTWISGVKRWLDAVMEAEGGGAAQHNPAMVRFTAADCFLASFGLSSPLAHPDRGILAFAVGALWVAVFFLHCLHVSSTAPAVTDQMEMRTVVKPTAVGVLHPMGTGSASQPWIPAGKGGDGLPGCFQQQIVGLALMLPEQLTHLVG
jgi:hypothetical protein